MKSPALVTNSILVLQVLVDDSHWHLVKFRQGQGLFGEEWREKSAPLGLPIIARLLCVMASRVTKSEEDGESSGTCSAGCD